MLRLWVAKINGDEYVRADSVEAYLRQRVVKPWEWTVGRRVRLALRFLFFPQTEADRMVAGVMNDTADDFMRIMRGEEQPT